MDGSPLGTPSATVLADRILRNRANVLQSQVVQLDADKSTIGARLAGVSAALLDERFVHANERAQWRADHAAEIASQKQLHQKFIATQANDFARRHAASMIDLAAADAATASAFAGSLAEMESELVQLERRRANEAAAHASHAASLVNDIQLLCTALKAERERCEQQRRDFEEDRKALIAAAEESQLRLRLAFASERCALERTMCQSVYSLEEEMECLREAHSLQLAEERGRHAEEVASIRGEHEGQVKRLEARINRAVEDNETLHEMLRVQAVEAEEARMEVEAAHLRYVGEMKEAHSKAVVYALSQQEGALREEMRWVEDALHNCQGGLADQKVEIEHLKALRKAERADHEKVVDGLHERLSEQHAALTSARVTMEQQRRELEGIKEERRHDGVSKAKEERSRSIYRLETGLSSFVHGEEARRESVA